VQRDPAHQWVNSYAYTEGNPVTRVDPAGLLPRCPTERDLNKECKKDCRFNYSLCKWASTGSTVACAILCTPAWASGPGYAVCMLACMASNIIQNMICLSMRDDCYRWCDEVFPQ